MSDALSLTLSTGLIASLPLVLAGGIISGFNPCCLPMIPSVVVLMNQHESKSRWKGFYLATLFVLGFAASTAAMGALTTLFGIVFGQFGTIFSYAVALILILMGLNLFGFFRINLPALSRSKAMQVHGGAFVTGMVFTFVVVPCSTPVLASVLTYAAATKSVATGAILLFIYGIGAGVPLIVMGSFMGWLGVLNYFNRHRKIINDVTGAILILAGLYFVWRA